MFAAFKISSTPIKTAMAFLLVITPNKPKQNNIDDIKR
jgi:hypothetical protein